MSDIAIRSVREADAEAVHEILMSRHVLEGSMRVPHSRLETTRERLEARPGLHQIVAVAADAVAGFGELVVHVDDPRGRHAGEVNLVAVHGDWRRKGVGRALMEELIDLALGWLNLERLGLVVFDGNTEAVRLYEALGFEHEGTLRRLNYRGGRYLDAHVMSRLR